MTIKRKRWHNLYVRYRMREDEWVAYWMHQDGKCGICGTSFHKRPPVVDHCHTSGHVRGLLCKQCNTALGCAEKGNWLENAKSYLTGWTEMKK